MERFKREWRNVEDTTSIIFPERNDTTVAETVERFKTEWRKTEDVVNPIVWLEDKTLTITNAENDTVFTLILPDKSQREMSAVVDGSTTFDLSTLGLTGSTKIIVKELDVSVTVTL